LKKKKVNNNDSTCGGKDDHKLSMQKITKEVREKTLQILYNVYSLKKLNWMAAEPSFMYGII
jgi:hypothetical protein